MQICSLIVNKQMFIVFISVKEIGRLDVVLLLTSETKLEFKSIKICISRVTYDYINRYLNDTYITQ